MILTYKSRKGRSLPVSVPGAVDGWIQLHEKFGNKEFASLFEPTIAYANDGFPVSELIAYYLDGSAKRFADYPNFKDVWMKNGSTPKKGEIFKNPELAKTLGEISKTKRESFYEGQLATTMANLGRVLRHSPLDILLLTLPATSP